MKKKGYIIVEVLISIFLFSLILNPLTKQINQYIRLKKISETIKNIELLEIKLELIKGYNQNLLEGKKTSLGLGIGVFSEEVKIILIKDKNQRINKIIFPKIENTNIKDRYKKGEKGDDKK
ncbi:MAG: hypothetical protein ACRCUA_05220 [Fusobacteriaceae bacterium]